MNDSLLDFKAVNIKLNSCTFLSLRFVVRYKVTGHNRFVGKIRESIDGDVLLSEPLCNHTTYCVGGDAEVLICPKNRRSAAWVYNFAKQERIPLVVLGAGSNVIAPDGGIEGIVLKMKTPEAEIHFIGNGRVQADSGVFLIDLARKAAREGLCGLENIAGIPGTVGGAIVMNAGTDEIEISELLHCIEVLTYAGRRRVFRKSELAFSYRHSIFRDAGWLILSAVLKLRSGDPVETIAKIDKILKEREERLPYDLPSAGSVFKRPPGDYAGRLIEEAGCKGMGVGGAVVSERHANFIVNKGNATSADIIELISRVRKKVYEKTGVYLDLEQIPLPTRVTS